MKSLISNFETTPWGWHGIKQPSGKHNTINILLTRGSRVMWNVRQWQTGRVALWSPVRFRAFRFNSVRIMLFACRRSMIQLNLHRSSCAETNDINGRTETTCDYAQTTHGKRLLLILLTGGRSEKHMMRESTQLLFGELAVTGGMECSSVVEQRPCKLCVTGSIPVFPIPYSGGIRRRYCGSIGLNPQLR